MFFGRKHIIWLAKKRTCFFTSDVYKNKDVMVCVSQENQNDIIEAFNSTSRQLNGLLNTDNIYFDQMMDRIYPTELQLNKANSSDIEVPFWIWNYLYLMVQFPLKFMMNGTIWFRYSRFPLSGWPAYFIRDIYLSLFDFLWVYWFYMNSLLTQILFTLINQLCDTGKL